MNNLLDRTDSPNPSSLRILLAEDNLINQRLTLRQLQLLGYSATVAVDGQAAVDTVKQFSFDVVLMDCQMPVLDGFDATAMIRAWEHQQPSQGCPIVVIAMTASNLEQDRERAMAIGMNDYIAKPVRKEVLANLLDHWHHIILSQSRLINQKVTKQSNAPEQTPLSHLDLVYLHRLSEDTPEFELELLTLFLEDSHIHLETLRQAVFQQNIQQVKHIAHHIKGASANVGAKVIQLLAEQLEHQRYPYQEAVTAELIAKLEFSLTQVQTFLNTMRDR